ncbi:MAG: hypothetical protein Q7S08_01425 [bacterium]|nr:hypothetical protein [bacterium]
MLKDTDIKKLKAVFPTKKDIRGIVQQELKGTDARFDRIETVVVSTNQHISVLVSRIDSMEETLERLVQGVDKLVTEFQELRREYAAMSEQLTRHERWIKQIARKAGVVLAE